MESKNRRFSAAFKKEKVELIDQGKISVKELSEIYEVSDTAIYRWIKKYSQIARDERVIVEKVSESQKNIDLLKTIRELERSVGQKQLELDYYKAIVDVIRKKAFIVQNISNLNVIINERHKRNIYNSVVDINELAASKTNKYCIWIQMIYQENLTKEF